MVTIAGAEVADIQYSAEPDGAGIEFDAA